MRLLKDEDKAMLGACKAFPSKISRAMNNQATALLS
jgi:hypothetical protein